MCCLCQSHIINHDLLKLSLGIHMLLGPSFVPPDSFCLHLTHPSSCCLLLFALFLFSSSFFCLGFCFFYSSSFLLSLLSLPGFCVFNALFSIGFMRSVLILLFFCFMFTVFTLFLPYFHLYLMFLPHSLPDFLPCLLFLHYSIPYFLPYFQCAVSKPPSRLFSHFLLVFLGFVYVVPGLCYFRFLIPSVVFLCFLMVYSVCCIQ